MIHYLSKGNRFIKYDDKQNTAIVVGELHTGTGDSYEFAVYNQFLPNATFESEKELYEACCISATTEKYYKKTEAKVLQEALFNLEDTYRPFLMQIKEMLDNQKEYFKTRDKELLKHCKMQEAHLYKQLEMMLEGNPV